MEPRPTHQRARNWSIRKRDLRENKDGEKLVLSSVGVLSKQSITVFYHNQEIFLQVQIRQVVPKFPTISFVNWAHRIKQWNVESIVLNPNQYKYTAEWNGCIVHKCWLGVCWGTLRETNWLLGNSTESHQLLFLIRISLLQIELGIQTQETPAFEIIAQNSESL